VLTATIRTHRERKEAYSASLESEVTELRALKARLSQDVAILTGLLEKNGIAIPGGALSGESERVVEKTKTVTLVVAQEENKKKKNQRRQICVQGMPEDVSCMSFFLSAYGLHQLTNHHSESITSSHTPRIRSIISRAIHKLHGQH